MLTELQEASIAKRRLILRDSLAILSLTLATAVIFAITLFLFRSFSAHRATLAQQAYQQGLAALQAHHPDDTVTALRAALSYAPGDLDYEQTLAEALGETGRPPQMEESYQYFMGLWEAKPGSGPINLALARLAAKRNDRAAAVNFYRAAIYGTWEGDGVARRADVRLELARYFIGNRDLAAARLELLIAGGNAPDDYSRDMSLGALLEQAQDATDASIFYQRAAAAKPSDPAALEAAGRLAYQSGDFESAHRLFARAFAEDEVTHAPAPADDTTLAADAGRILELMPLPSLPARERVDRILTDRAIAAKRFDACSARFAAPIPLPSDLQALKTRLAGPDGTANAAALLHDPAQQESAMQLVYDTEAQTAKLCGAPTGDDALLLRMAGVPRASTQSEAARLVPVTVPHD